MKAKLKTNFKKQKAPLFYGPPPPPGRGGGFSPNSPPRGRIRKTPADVQRKLIATGIIRSKPKPIKRESRLGQKKLQLGCRSNIGQRRSLNK